jgi:hypothetical protein
MPAKKWYKDYRFVVPIAVALIGLVGILLPGWMHSHTSQNPIPVVVLAIDQDTGQPIAGVHLQAAEQGLAGETDNQGRSTLLVRPELKRLRITGSKTGFERSDVEVDLLSEMSPVRLLLRTSPAGSGASPMPDTATFSVIVVVLDSVTGQGIPGAHVLLDEQGVSQETDSQGRCTIAVRADLKKLRITISKPRYKIEDTEVDLFKGMNPLRVHLAQVVAKRKTVSAKVGAKRKPARELEFDGRLDLENYCKREFSLSLARFTENEFLCGPSDAPLHTVTYSTACLACFGSPEFVVEPTNRTVSCDTSERTLPPCTEEQQPCRSADIYCCPRPVASTN